MGSGICFGDVNFLANEDLLGDGILCVVMLSCYYSLLSFVMLSCYYS